MKQIQKKAVMATALFLSVSVIAGLSFPVKGHSAEEAARPQFNAGISIADNLAVFKGRTVTVHLSSGQEVSGTVKEVKNGVLHLEKIVQKEYYDAVILLDRISAVEARVRDKL